MKKGKTLGNESEKIVKAREKLQKKLREIDQQVTQEALKNKVKEIHYWISRHVNNRIVLKNKNISLFDENKNTAKLSKYVLGVLNKIEQEGNTLKSNENFKKKINISK